jgi:hypothetical protein
MSKARECDSCGSLSSETRFPVERIPEIPDMCLDCTLEYASEITREQRCAETRAAIAARGGIGTRASYRAALRHRQSLDQLDLVDLIVRTP